MIHSFMASHSIPSSLCLTLSFLSYSSLSSFSFSFSFPVMSLSSFPSFSFSSPKHLFISSLLAYLFHRVIKNYFHKQKIHSALKKAQNDKKINFLTDIEALRIHPNPKENISISFSSPPTDNILIPLSVHSDAKHFLSTTPLSNDILHCSQWEILREKCLSGQWSATLIVKCFIMKSIIISYKCNAFSETLFSKGIKWAEQLDQKIKIHNEKPKGREEKSLSPSSSSSSSSDSSSDSSSFLPLAGIPITLKDSVGVSGVDCTLGLVKYHNANWRENSLLVEILISKGAIPFAKTNVPQTLLSFECSNPIFGRTKHPFDGKETFTPGGSSGGESCLIGGGGSLVGIGTDIGGSVRIPAHFCGIYAIKPSSRRISTLGFRSSLPGQEAVPGVAGVMGNSVEIIAKLLNEIVCKDIWERDSEVFQLPLNVEEINRNDKMTFGFYDSDDFMESSPPCRRAVRETVEALRREGHTVITFTPPSVKKGNIKSKLFDRISPPPIYHLICDVIHSQCDGHHVNLYFIPHRDGGKTMTNQLDCDVWEDYVKTIVTSATLPSVAKSVLSLLAKHIGSDDLVSEILNAAGEVSVTELWKLQMERKKYRGEWFEAMRKAKVDAIITTAHFLPAVHHHAYGNISFSAAPTMIFNVLDWPAGVVPTTTVKKEMDQWTSPCVGILSKRVRSAYRVDEMDGLPIGVQVISTTNKEDTTLRAMKQVDFALKKNKKN